ncbi:MAG: asparagine synthetase B family protein [Acidobacteriota bacterium]|nr:asparagine synthetase B family protein [Blastocatellia bacterium]MDW8412748.1 asparagine synthetase B family protein [Acidobacteriota bacterium]
MRQLLGCWYESTEGRQLASVKKTFISNRYITELDYSSDVLVTFSGEALTIVLSASGLADDFPSRIEVTRDELRLLRDPFGRTQLYWAATGKAIWFSSRVDLLMRALKLAEIDERALYLFTGFSYFPAPETPIVGIRSAAAGQCLIWRSAGQDPEIITYHDWCCYGDKGLDEAAAASKLRVLLDNSMESLLPKGSYTRCGVFLSGGLDSSVVAALLERHGVRPICYTLDFGEHCQYKEIEYAAAVAEHLGLELKVVDASAERIAGYLRPTIRALDVPYGDGVAVPLYLLGKAAAEDGCDVVFNGEGGDQLFAGWPNKPLIAAKVYNSQCNLEAEYLKTFHRFFGAEHLIFTEKMLAVVAEVNPLDWVKDALDWQGTTIFDLLRRANLKLKGAQNIQPRATRLAEVHSLWVRSPFCYAPLVTMLNGLRGELLLKGACEKYILKRAVEDLLPPKIVWREKRGMGVPLTRLLLGPLRQELLSLLDEQVLAVEGRFCKDVAVRIAKGRFSAQIQGRRIGELLWLLLVWQAWRYGVERCRAPRYSKLLTSLIWRWRSAKEEYLW